MSIPLFSLCNTDVCEILLSAVWYNFYICSDSFKLSSLLFHYWWDLSIWLGRILTRFLTYVSGRQHALKKILLGFTINLVPCRTKLPGAQWCSTHHILVWRAGSEQCWWLSSLFWDLFASNISSIGWRTVFKALLVNYLSLRFTAATEFNDFVIKQMPWDHFCLIHFAETIFSCLCKLALVTKWGMNMPVYCTLLWTTLVGKVFSLHQGGLNFFHAEWASSFLLHSVRCNDKTAAVSGINSGFAGQSVHFSLFFFCFVLLLCLCDLLVTVILSSLFPLHPLCALLKHFNVAG